MLYCYTVITATTKKACILIMHKTGQSTLVVLSHYANAPERKYFSSNPPSPVPHILILQTEMCIIMFLLFQFK